MTLNRLAGPTPESQRIGKHIRALREQAGERLTDTTEKAALPCSYTTLGRIETGRRGITKPIAEALATHFNVPVSILLDEVAPPEDPPLLQWAKEPPRQEPSVHYIVDHQQDTEPGLIATDHRTDSGRPLTPDEYRVQVWLPYLESLYAADHQHTA